MGNPVKYIIVHNSAVYNDGRSQLQGIENTHKERFNFKSELGYYTGYQYVIDTNSSINQRRKDDEQGAHCKENHMNFQSIGICLCMNGDQQMPTPEQESSFTSLALTKMEEWDIPLENVDLHRQYATYKSCPGTKITEDYINGLLSTNSKRMSQINALKDRAEKVENIGFVEQFKDGSHKLWIIYFRGEGDKDTNRRQWLKSTEELLMNADVIRYGTTEEISEIPEKDPIK